MAENSVRHRSSDPYDRSDQPDRQRYRDDAPLTDPLAELARLIGQRDPFVAHDHHARPAQSESPPLQVPHDDWRAPEPRADEWTAQPQAPAEVHAAQPPAYDPYAQPVHQAGDRHYDPRSYRVAPQTPEPDPVLLEPAYAESSMPPPTLQGPPPSFMRGGEAEYLDDDAPPRRSRKLAIAAVLGLAVIGTAGAYGYRTMFSPPASPGSAPVIRANNEPTKVAPPAAVANDSSSKLTYDRFGDRSQNERVVSREEQPLDLKDVVRNAPPPKAVATNVVAATPPAPPMNGNPSSVLTEPKRVRTETIRPDQANANASANGARMQPSVAQPGSRPAAAAGSPPLDAPPTRAPARGAQPNAPLSISPDAVSPTRTAAIPPTASASSASSGGYAVQVSSQRSEADAQSSYRSIRSKFSGVLGDRQSFVKRADLGEKGTYYRAMVGPFQSRDQAVQLCGSLKAAGGDCVVQTN